MSEWKKKRQVFRDARFVIRKSLGRLHMPGYTIPRAHSLAKLPGSISAALLPVSNFVYQMTVDT